MEFGILDWLKNQKRISAHFLKFFSIFEGGFEQYILKTKTEVIETMNIPSDLCGVIFSFLATDKTEIHQELDRIGVLQRCLKSASYVSAFRLYKFLFYLDLLPKCSFTHKTP